MHGLFFQDQPMVFDERVEIVAPPEAEDSMNVPVVVRYPALADDAEELLVFVDYNPIPRALQFYPEGAGPLLGFHIRLQQASPVRAAVRTADGVWHVNGRWVDAAGGGCTLPKAVVSTVDEDAIGQVHGRVWNRDDGSQRVSFHVTHPMDTGLVSGIPAYYVEELSVEDAEGKLVARLNTFEPVSENPIFTFDIKGDRVSQVFHIEGRDNNGLEIEADLR
jgi:sulfur-oxidizing protein SoxY